jgi:hypothetical protein
MNTVSIRSDLNGILELPSRVLCYDIRGVYIGLNVYDMIPREGIYAPIRS